MRSGPPPRRMSAKYGWPPDTPLACGIASSRHRAAAGIAPAARPEQHPVSVVEEPKSPVRTLGPAPGRAVRGLRRPVPEPARRWGPHRPSGLIAWWKGVKLIDPPHRWVLLRHSETHRPRRLSPDCRTPRPPGDHHERLRSLARPVAASAGSDPAQAPGNRHDRHRHPHPVTAVSPQRSISPRPAFPRPQRGSGGPRSFWTNGSTAIPRLCDDDGGRVGRPRPGLPL